VCVCVGQAIWGEKIKKEKCEEKREKYEKKWEILWECTKSYIISYGNHILGLIKVRLWKRDFGRVSKVLERESKEGEERMWKLGKFSFG